MIDIEYYVGNNLTDEAAKYLGEVLKHNSTLANLNLHGVLNDSNYQRNFANSCHNR